MIQQNDETGTNPGPGDFFLKKIVVPVSKNVKGFNNRKSLLSFYSCNYGAGIHWACGKCKNRNTEHFSCQGFSEGEKLTLLWSLLS